MNVLDLFTFAVDRVRRAGELLSVEWDRTGGPRGALKSTGNTGLLQTILNAVSGVSRPLEGSRSVLINAGWGIRPGLCIESYAAPPESLYSSIASSHYRNI